MVEIKGLRDLLESKDLELHKRKTGDFHVAANNELKDPKLSNEMNLHKSA